MSISKLQAAPAGANPSTTPTLLEVADQRRRQLLRGGLAGSLTAAFGAVSALGLSGCVTAPPAVPAVNTRQPGFQSAPLDLGQPLSVPPGYVARVLYRWGDAVGVAGQMPLFRPDSGNSAEEQALQAGMHHDGMAYFPIQGSARHGLLAVNHEYTDERLLHPGGVVPGWRSVEQVAKSMASHGLSVVEVQADRQLRWSVQRPSRYARRITARTPIRLAGPAAGHALMRTSVDPQGVRVEGTLANCAGSATPWGTYLCGEENFHYYFEPPTTIDAHAKRWGLHAGSNQMLWSLREERFDLRLEPNEFHRYGWMVEVDPFDPESTPVKRTALGRAAHEGAACALNSDGRAVIFMGEDAVFEYLYKFVSRDPMRPGGATANRDLLDHGTLYVARFKTDGSGAWLPLVHGVGPLTAENGFADQAEVLIRSREAADLLAATRLDRPEWTAIDPNSGECYVSLTGNTLRGRIGYPSPDAVNPRGPNPLGHILRWRQRQDLADTRFEWDLFALAGDTAGDAFGGPDSLLIDPRGMLWVATDTPSTETLPRNQLLACDPTRSGGPEMRRFLVGPPGCEITGPVMAPDCRTLFVNIQHPGEKMGLQPPYAEAWPQPGLPPRSATIAITRLDGGIVGT